MLKINELARLYIGVQQENAARTITIDMSAWASLYPNASVEILHKRSGDQTKYVTGATYDSETKILSWTPTEYDTFYDGFGIAEVRMVENNVVKKSKDLIVVAVSPSAIDGTGDVIQSNYQAWLNTALGYKQEALAAQQAAETAQGLAEDAQDAAEDAADAAELAIEKWPKIDATTKHWMVWDVENGEYIDTGISATGPKGDKGDPGDPGGPPGKDFTIAKTFASVSAMLSYTGTDIEEHEFALINSTDADNGKLFQYEPNKNLLDLTTLKAPAVAGQTYSYSLTATWDGVGQIIYIWHDGGTSGESIGMFPKPRSGQSITTTGTTTAEAGCTGFTFSFPSGVEVTAGSVTAKWIYVGNLSTSMTVPIDDTAGTGVTNKVWSADKSASENSALQSAINTKLDEPSTAGTSGQVLTSDGEGGQAWADPSGGAEIDDTAGAGDTDVVWSADKTITEIQQIIVSGGVPIDDTAGQGDIDKIWSANKCYEMKSSFDLFTTEVPSKNLYDKNSCNPQDGKTYNNTYGSVSDSANFAITGLIPVSAETEYIFSAGGVRVYKVNYFSGATGGTYLSYESISNNSSFTTPASCTFVGVVLFNTSHTTAQFNDAINVGQLERGSTATAFEPYGSVGYSFSLPATTSDEGKPLTPKTVSGGKVVEWEYKEIETVEIDNTLTQTGEAADSKTVGDIVNDLAPIVYSKNLYNKTACNPQNGKTYNSSSGAVEDGESYAISGKMPVDAQTQYIFSNGGLAKVKRAFYFKGADGSTFISNEVLDNAAFTTPALCTFVGFSLFASTHTAEQYSDAIDACQLEKGNVATDFVPYSETRKVPTNRLVDGNALQGAANSTVFTSLINVFDKTKAEDGKYFNTTYDEVYSSGDYGFSGLIPVKPNTQYCFSKDPSVSPGTLPSSYQEWSSSKTLVAKSTLGNATNAINQIHTGSTTYYVSFNITFGGSHTTEQYNAVVDSLMVVEGTQRPATYIAYYNEPVVNHLKLDNMYQLNTDVFREKKWLVTGTSVSYWDSKPYTGGVHTGDICSGYIGNVARRKPMIITNEGISGSTLADTTQDSSLINRYQSLNFASYDFITIEYGINDFGRDIAVGTANDAAGTSSFAACLKTIIEYALGQNPKVGLIICTEPDVRGTTQNNNNNTLKDYTDVTLEIAKQYRLPVCDWYYHSGINALTKGSTSVDYLTADGTHPNNDGHMRMGAMLNQVFDNLLC